jgi:hypothetical protein
VQEIGNGRAASGLVVAYITQNMSSWPYKASSFGWKCDLSLFPEWKTYILMDSIFAVPSFNNVLLHKEQFLSILEGV